MGKGSVYAGQSLAEAFSSLKLAPDFDYTKPQSDTNILFVHRKLNDGDVYYVDSRIDKDTHVDATFRVTGMQAELWHPETGKVEPASYTISNGRTTVPLTLDPWGTVFVVFRKPAKSPSHILPKVVETKLASVDGPWTVSFQPDRGALASTTLNSLTSWSENADSGVKYFSGVGTYTKTITAPESWFKSGAQVWLDLGDVRNMADVTVNGKPLGLVWHAPYHVDVTRAMKPGANEVVIKVTNAWVNRLIGDQQPNATKYTFTVIHPYKATSPLLPSGLLGPVEVRQAAAE